MGEEWGITLSPLDWSNVKAVSCNKLTSSSSGGENSSFISPYIQLDTGKIVTAVSRLQSIIPWVLKFELKQWYLVIQWYSPVNLGKVVITEFHLLFLWYFTCRSIVFILLFGKYSLVFISLWSKSAPGLGMLLCSRPVRSYTTVLEKYHLLCVCTAVD